MTSRRTPNSTTLHSIAMLYSLRPFYTAPPHTSSRHAHHTFPPPPVHARYRPWRPWHTTNPRAARLHPQTSVWATLRTFCTCWTAPTAPTHTAPIPSLCARWCVRLLLPALCGRMMRSSADHHSLKLLNQITALRKLLDHHGLLDLNV